MTSSSSATTATMPSRSVCSLNRSASSVSRLSPKSECPSSCSASCVIAPRPAPPVDAVHQRHARTYEQDASFGKPTEQAIKVRQPESSLDGDQRRPHHGARAEHERVASDREEREECGN